MTSHKGVRALAFAAVFVLVGGGCTTPFTKKEKVPLPAEETKKVDISGDNFEEQADIIVDAALEEALFEEQSAGNVEGDASLFTNDEQELNNLEKSYDESEL